MKAEVRAKRIGGSIGVIIPKNIVRQERISENDKLTVKVEKVADLSFMWGMCKDVKTPTDEIMREIDEGEFDE